jgi:hypothetical protein
MAIVTTDVTQRKIHKASHGGGNIGELLLARMGVQSIETKTTRRDVVKRVDPEIVARYSPRGFSTGKLHRGLSLANCSTDVYGENDQVLWTLEIKYSMSSKTCRKCKKTEDVHTQIGCEHSTFVIPNHKNCKNRFGSAIGSITKQRNCSFTKSLGKPLVPCFLYVDLVDVGGSNSHHDGGADSDMEHTRLAGGRVEVFTHEPTSEELDGIADRLCGLRFGLVYS